MRLPSNCLSFLAVAPTLVLVVATFGCSYSVPWKIEGPITRDLRLSEQRSFDDRKEKINHGIFHEVLRSVVREPEGCIDVGKLKTTYKNALKDYLVDLSKVDVKNLSNREQLSLLINAHNAFALLQVMEVVSTSYGVASMESIADSLERRLKSKKVELAETKMTLRQLREGVIRPVFKDPRVFFVLANGTTELAPFHSYSLSGSVLRLQLDTMTRAMIKDKRYVDVDETGKVLLNRLFKRASIDIVNTRNRPHTRSLREWLYRYSDDDLRSVLKRAPQRRFGTLDPASELVLCQ